MSVRDSDDTIIVTSRKASDNEFIQIRYTAAVKEKDPLTDVPTEERGDVSEIEVNYVYVSLDCLVFNNLILTLQFSLWHINAIMYSF